MHVKTAALCCINIEKQHQISIGVTLFRHILVPVDGEKLSLKALSLGAELANVHEAQLTIMTVTPTYPPFYGGEGYVLDVLTSEQWQVIMVKKTKAIKAGALKHIDKQRIKSTSPKASAAREANFLQIESGSVYQAIIDTAKRQKCDLIVMASHGRRGLSALLLGSEATKVLTHSTLPVLICR
jgi:nucleotide-binding universal stress UspA family protein